MKILCASNNYFHFRGHSGVKHLGSEVNFQRYIAMALALRENGHSVLILALDAGYQAVWPKVNEFKWKGLSVWTITVPRFLHYFRPLFLAIIFPMYLFLEFWIVRKSEIKIIRADGYIAGPTSVVLKAFLKKKVVYEDVDDFSSFEKKPFYKKVIRFFEKVAIENSDMVVCASNIIREKRCHHLRMRAKKIIVLHNGVNTQVFQPLPEVEASSIRGKLDLKGCLVLAFVGRLYDYEGTEIAIRAMPFFSEKKVRLLVIGDGPELPRLQELSKSLGIGDRVNFLGWIDNEEVAKYIAIADVCLLPYLNKASAPTVEVPIKLMEYLAVGKPVVASNVGNLKEMIKGAGLTIPPNDPFALARAILDAQRNLEKLSKQAILISKSYDWKHVATNEIKELMDVIRT